MGEVLRGNVACAKGSDVICKNEENDQRNKEYRRIIRHFEALHGRLNSGSEEMCFDGRKCQVRFYLVTLASENSMGEAISSFAASNGCRALHLIWSCSSKHRRPSKLLAQTVVSAGRCNTYSKHLFCVEQATVAQSNSAFGH